MTRASKNHVGSGTKGKGSGSGAMTEMPRDKVEENVILSNRDKKQHSEKRGFDSRRVQTEQNQGRGE